MDSDGEQHRSLFLLQVTVLKLKYIICSGFYCTFFSYFYDTYSYLKFSTQMMDFLLIITRTLSQVLNPNNGFEQFDLKKSQICSVGTARDAAAEKNAEKKERFKTTNQTKRT